MLKIYDVIDYVSIDGADWRRVGGYGYRVTDNEIENTLILNGLSFDEVREYLSQNALCGVWNDSTFFLGKPTIRISYNDVWSDVEYRKFNKMSYKSEFKERRNVSLEWIIGHLSADQCIQYLKERGMTACPIMK
jgi:hypothetical protein